MDPKTDTTITPDQADALLKLNLTNILKKAKAGNTLSKEERKIIEQYAGKPNSDPMPMEAIAAALGTSRQTLYDLRKAYPDKCPTGKAAKYLANWEYAVKTLKGSGKTSQEDDNTKAGFQVKKLRIEVEAMQLKLDKDKGLLISSDDYSATIINLVTKTKEQLRWYLETNLPARLEGLSAGAIREKCKEACDDICRILSNPDSYESKNNYEPESFTVMAEGLDTPRPETSQSMDT